jgi:hypothetical protein
MKAKVFFWICLVLVGVGLAIAVLPTNAAPARQEAAPVSTIEGDYLTQIWKTGIWGAGIGASGMTAFDMDGDGQTEIVLGGGYDFGDDKFWYVLSYDSQSGNYRQEWLSKEYTSSDIYRLVVADPAGSGQYRIYVALSDGTVEVYDAAARQMLETFTTPYTISAITFADVDGDTGLEIITSSSDGLAVLNGLTYDIEWQSSSNGSSDIAVANVDADPALEIVTTRRVIDGVTHTVEWDYPSSFGLYVCLADIDADNMAEIIASMDWYYIYAYDADTQTTKWSISATYDIGALYVGDVDNDTIQEVVYGDAQWGAIHGYDSVTLQEEWSIENPTHGVTDIIFADPDNDSVTEVLWSAGWNSSGPDYLYVGDMTIQAIEWQSLDIVGPLSALDAGDVDNDGTDEIVMVSFRTDSYYNSGIVFIYNAETYALEWQSDPLLGGLALLGTNALELADVDEDGILEIVIATAYLHDGIILAFDGITHDLDWQTEFYDGTSFSALAIADSDNDGHLEVISGQEQRTTGAEGVFVCVFDGLTGIEEWHTADLGDWRYVYDIAVGDSDNDGNPEILFSLQGNYAYVYDGVTHNQDWQSSISSVDGVLIADVDQDNQHELLIGTYNGSVYAYDGQTYALEWTLAVSNTYIFALRLTDFELDNSKELVLCDNNSLYIYDSLTRDLIWKSDLLGSYACFHGHLVIRDIDVRPYDEVILGNSYALYVFTFDALPFLASLDVSHTLSVPEAPLTYTLQIQNL